MKKAKIQVGIDRYTTILKRVRSPNSSQMESAPKKTKDNEPNKAGSHNRFALLGEKSDEPTPTAKAFKPPPIYLRETNSGDLIKCLISLIGKDSFHVIPIKRGSINETKIQVNNETDYRKLVADFETRKKNFYTYQLKSSKGLQVVIKGIDSYVDIEDIKSELENNGFKIKNVTNIRNREKIPQPMFRIELQPGDLRLKKNETHPIYNLRYLLHRKITVEEPHKRSGPVQCQNCQEFGHTRSYCKLPSVCVVCGELHDSSQCDKPKQDSTVRKCSNCGQNHTASYRGCPIFVSFKRSLTQKATPPPLQKLSPASFQPVIRPTSNPATYANILKSNNIPIQLPTQDITNPTLNSVTSEKNPVNNYGRLEATIETLVQTVTNFTTNMNNMMQQILNMQSMLLQALAKKP